MPEENVTYLGDGVYLRLRLYDVELYTSDGIQEHNHIYLEPDIVANFMKFLKEHGRLPKV